MLAPPVQPPPVESPPIQALIAPSPNLAAPWPEVETDGPPSRRSRWQLLPSWLVSLVIHLNFVILLGLLTWRSELAIRVGELEASLGSADEGAGLTTLDAPSDLPDAEFSADATEPLVPPASETNSKLAIPEPQLQLVLPSSTAAAGAKTADGAEATGGEATGQSPGGNAQRGKTALYGLQAEGRRFLYVVDRSASMNSVFQTTAEGKRPISFMLMDGAKTELLASIQQLQQKQTFQVLFYNHEIMKLHGRWASQRFLPATERNKTFASELIYQVYGAGETFHLPPLEQALRMRPDVIFLLTDGEAKDDPSVTDLARLKRLNTGRASINVVQICQVPRIDSTLIQLATENGGQHRFLNLNELYEAMRARGAVESPRKAAKD